MKKLIFFICGIFIFLSSTAVVHAYDGYNPENLDEPVIEQTFESTLYDTDIEQLDETVTYTITFETNGGFYLSNSTYYYTLPEQIVFEGGQVEEPITIKCHGYVFQYWALSDGTKWDFNNDLVYSNFTLYAIWKYNLNQEITDPLYHIQNGVYPGSYGWYLANSNSTQNERGGDPVEAGTVHSGTALNYDDELQIAIELSGVPSTYGGCGPIALIGILDYLSRTTGYTSLLADPNDYHERIRLANLVLQNTPTIEIGFVGDKNTFTWPSDYMGAFNTMISMGNLNSQLSITQYGALSTNNTKYAQIKNSIDRGIPVTVWTYGNVGDGLDWGQHVDNHYFNIYGYEEYRGYDSSGNFVSKTMYKARMNWGRTYIEYVDEDVFTGLWGIFVYNETYQPQLIRPQEYGYPSQYHFYEIMETARLSNGFSFITNRLRTGYVWSYINDIPDKRYLVLSAKREGAGTAFLQYQFTIPIKAINFDISLWSGNEGLNSINDSVRLEYKDSNGNWILAKEFYKNQFGQLSTIKTIPDNHYITFGTGAYEIRFVVECSSPTGTRNNGRVVIGDITIMY